MKQSIDNLISDFQTAYQLDKQSWDRKSVSELNDYADKYVVALNISDSEKRIVLSSFFENYLSSMYKRDFEKRNLEEQVTNYTIDSKQEAFTKTCWGLAAGTFGYLTAAAFNAPEIVSLIAAGAGYATGYIFAHNGIRDSGLGKDSIPGTHEYDMNLRTQLEYALDNI